MKLSLGPPLKPPGYRTPGAYHTHASPFPSPPSFLTPNSQGLPSSLELDCLCNLPNKYSPNLGLDFEFFPS